MSKSSGKGAHDELPPTHLPEEPQGLATVPVTANHEKGQGAEWQPTAQTPAFSPAPSWCSVSCPRQALEVHDGPGNGTVAGNRSQETERQQNGAWGPVSDTPPSC